MPGNHYCIYCGRRHWQVAVAFDAPAPVWIARALATYCLGTFLCAHLETRQVTW